MTDLCVICSTSVVNTVRSVLQEHKLNDPDRRLKFLKADGLVAVPVKCTVSKDILLEILQQNHDLGSCINNIEIRHENLPKSKKLSVKSPHTVMIDRLKSLVIDSGHNWTDKLHEDIPSHWERHGDLVLIPDTTFTLTVWKSIGDKVWENVVESLGCKRLACKSKISIDGYRTPQVYMLYGDNGLVEHVDNGIRYTYDITKCMFSMGNITEKLRVANMCCRDEIVVDLYAGIGYFTLPYLVHSGVKHLHACEWNQNAVEALQKNLELNGVTDRCTLHAGDNRQVCPRGIADRVNLGLIPSSREGWPVACAALKPDTGGILHVHYNVNTKLRTGNQNKNESFEPADVFRHEAKSHHGISDSVLNTANCIDDSSTDRITNNTKHCVCSKVKDHKVAQFKVCEYCESRDCDSKMVHLHDVNADNSGDTDYLMSNKDCDTNIKQTYKDSKCHNVEISKWYPWAQTTSKEIREILYEVHHSEWTTRILHIEHVKSYAPYVDHVVLDLECRPCCYKVS
ncbi:tRNA wybutosine-synthesizing protein 2 [Mactra antiquata]